jgi:hypothetical protein
MSQERTRFPIQPKDVRRSATSNRDVAVSGEPPRRRGSKDPDKPDGPPPGRGKASEETASDED